MRIAFLQPDFTHKRFNENFAMVDRHFGVFPDVGLATAAAVARECGAQVRMWDAHSTGASLETVLEEMRGWGPDLLAVAFHSVPTIIDVLGWAGRLRKALGVPLLVGGHEVARYGRDVMDHEVVDHVLVGRAAVVLPAYLEALERGAGLEDVGGLVWRDGEEVVENAAKEDDGSERDPYPARDLLPNETYYSHLTQRSLYTVLLTSSGCPFTCTFCAMARTGYHPRPVEDVVAEMEGCIRDLGIHEFDLFDPLLLHDRRRTLELCGEIAARRLDMEWACRSRIDDVDEEILAAAAGAGCRRIYFGIESGDPYILGRISKKISLERIRRVIAMTRDHGIHPLGFFQIGSPGETVESARRTIRFALDLPLDYAQFMRTIAKPGSRLEQAVMSVTGTDPWREYVRGRRDDSPLPAPWTRLSRRQVDGLVREAYMRFYLRPHIAGGTLLGARSLAEGARYVKVGLRMMLHGPD